MTLFIIKKQKINFEKKHFKLNIFWSYFQDFLKLDFTK